jgi:hypothetical protein
MAVKMFVRTKSGKDFLVSTNAGIEGKTPEELMDAFYAEMKLHELGSLRAGNIMFMVSEIEAVWFS